MSTSDAAKESEMIVRRAPCTSSPYTSSRYITGNRTKANSLASATPLVPIAIWAYLETAG
jgi:hypothetical protein